jgi:hypothetical protein
VRRKTTTKIKNIKGQKKKTHKLQMHRSSDAKTLVDQGRGSETDEADATPEENGRHG